jgi:acylphosphatase
MGKDEKRAEIIANGLVQGVGFRYYIIKNAESLKLKGYTKNLFSGEVVTVVEGSKADIEELFKRIRIGPSHASVRNCNINWEKSKNEFTHFEVRY